MYILIYELISEDKYTLYLHNLQNLQVSLCD